MTGLHEIRGGLERIQSGLQSGFSCNGVVHTRKDETAEVAL